MQSLKESALIQKRLLALQNRRLKDFTAKLIPSIEKERIIGIATPDLRKLAKELFKDAPEETSVFIKKLPHRFFEENNLHAFFLEQISDFDELLRQTEVFLPFVDNWATCDLFSPKMFKKNPEKTYECILCWLQSQHTYTLRYAIGLLLSNYLDKEFKPEMLDLVAKVTSEDYYVHMMSAWYFSSALVKQYEYALPYIKRRSFCKFIQNKTIQKAIESKRIPDDKKAYLKTFKTR